MVLFLLMYVIVSHCEPLSHLRTTVIFFICLRRLLWGCNARSFCLIILIFQMRFLNCRNGRKEPSKSILDVGVEAAIKFSGFDEKMFLKRGGKYVWSKADMILDW